MRFCYEIFILLALARIYHGLLRSIFGIPRVFDGLCHKNTFNLKSIDEDILFRDNSFLLVLRKTKKHTTVGNVRANTVVALVSCSYAIHIIYR